MFRIKFLPLLLASFIFTSVFSFAQEVRAEILHPYVIDEKSQVIFGDSAELPEHFGLENYTNDFVNGYRHITFTYTHHSCCYASYPPLLYITDVDPRTSAAPLVKEISLVHALYPYIPTDWYFYDIQFDATGYTVVVKQAGVTEIFNEHRNTPDIQDSDWVSLANHYPLNNPSLPNSMSFTPLPIRESTPGCVVDCYSNVLFLPGIKGSVLKKGSDTLWPPTVMSNDVPQLALNDSGESINNIHTNGILNTFYKKSIYAPLSSFMDSISGEGKLVNEWLPLAYDWRFSPEQILEDGIKTENEVINVIQRIEQLAEDSKTGKVAIVAHSMGGLLGKAIIKKLADEGRDELIESFVMVATPQLGSPQAMASVLHGNGEDILGGFIVHPGDIRAVARNMPSAHNLLPSPRYFNTVPDPVIKFRESNSIVQTWRDFWGESINTYVPFLKFVTGDGVPRDRPTHSILRVPEVLRSDLMAGAADFHNTYDNYQFPEHIRVVQVAGWGSPTTKAVEYKGSHNVLSYESIHTVEGDNAVVYSSAISSVADETYFFNIIDYNKAFNSNAQHRDLLNTNTLQSLVQSVTKKEDITNIDFLSTTKPPVANIEDQLVVSSHSPVILGAYDHLGNFTGIDPNQDLSAEILEIKEDIPGSTFTYTSESQYIFLPKEGNYNFVYQGIGEGPTTVKIDNFSADVVTPVVQYTDIPTTVSTKAEFTVTSSAPEETVLDIDADGDGDIDEVVYEDHYEFSLNELINQIKEKINSLNAKDKLKQNLIKRIENLEKKIQKKKEGNIKILLNFEKKITKQEIIGKINTADATQITSLLDVLEAESDSVALDSSVLTELKAKITSLNIKQALKKDLLKRVERLENKRVLVKNLSNLSKDITRKIQKGRIVDAEAQEIINIINQIEGVI